MRIHHLVVGVFIGLSCGMFACGGGGGSTGPHASSKWKKDFPVTVTPGSVPVISWQGGTAKKLGIFQENTEELIWMIEGQFSPPVTFGELPAGAKGASPKLLAPGIEYTVGVVLSDDKAGNVVFEAAAIAAGACTPASTPGKIQGSCLLEVPDKGQMCVDFIGAKFNSPNGRAELCKLMKGSLAETPCKEGAKARCLNHCGSPDEGINNFYFGTPDELTKACAMQNGTLLK